MKKNTEQGKAEAFYRVVAPFFQTAIKVPYSLIEFCAGNGKGGLQFYQSKQIKKVTFVDIKKVRGLERSLSEMHDMAQVDVGGIEKFSCPYPSDLAIIAIHACNTLTDKILAKAVQARVPVAVMPCCYNDQMQRYELEHPPNPRLLLYPALKDYYDAVRTQFLREQGYQVALKQMDAKITPMNNVIIGLPQ